MIHSRLSFTNTMTRNKELFTTLSDKRVLLYVCGITPYDYPHLGHARVYIFFDCLVRLFRHLDYQVVYCRNFTDIDDKLIAQATALYADPQRYKDIADHYIAAFQQDMHQLGCQVPTYEPRVTDVIPQIITFIEELIQKGHAYQVQGDVYFCVASYPSYGSLSCQKLDELRIGARVERNEHKKDPLDFALWKSEENNTYWQSPWGWGRPGWHIECSAMARHFLADTIDIHGGGADLLFPHHENERAQTESLTQQRFSNFWLHNAFVQINKQKMSKSLGNFFTIRSIIAHYPAMLIRFLMLNHHYRSPIDFSLEHFEQLKKSYNTLCFLASEGGDNTPLTQQDFDVSIIYQKIMAFLYDDFNTVGALGVLFKHQILLKNNHQERKVARYILQNIMGLDLVALKEDAVSIDESLQLLIDARTQAREQKDWQKADMLRDELIKRGYTPSDTKS